jgi:hypothetical protein
MNVKVDKTPGQQAFDTLTGTLQASAPDIGFALAGEAAQSKEQQRGYEIAKTVVPAMIGLVVNSNAITPKLPKKTSTKDEVAKAIINEQIKADQEAVSPIEKSKAQIEIDAKNKMNSEPKTVGKMTPELIKEYNASVKSGYKGSPSDFLKAKESVAPTPAPVPTEPKKSLLETLGSKDKMK